MTSPLSLNEVAIPSNDITNLLLRSFLIISLITSYTVIYIYIYIYTHIYIYIIYIYIYIHIYIHTHTHTHTYIYIYVMCIFTLVSFSRLIHLYLMPITIQHNTSSIILQVGLFPASCGIMEVSRERYIYIYTHMFRELFYFSRMLS